jgi:hypothetical protein
VTTSPRIAIVGAGLACAHALQGVGDISVFERAPRRPRGAWQVEPAAAPRRRFSGGNDWVANDRDGTVTKIGT